MRTGTRILEAATALLRAEGPGGLSMRRLGAEIGLSPMAVYRHFPGKEPLLDAVAEAGFGRLEGALHLQPGLTRPRPRIEARLDAYLEFALSEPHVFELLFLTRRTSILRFPDDFERGRSRAFRELREDVESLSKAASGSAHGLEQTLSLWALAHGLLTLHSVGRFGSDAGPLRMLYRGALGRYLDALA